MSAGATNAPGRPEFEGQLVKFRSPHASSVILYDIVRVNGKYGWLEWCAVNDPTQEQVDSAMWMEA